LHENGLGAKKALLSISRPAMRKIISQYTLEAGLRGLEREIASICRKVARLVAEKKKGPFKVTPKNLHRFLGPPKFIPEMDKEESQVGLATGLAWTQVGGEVLYVETSLIAGKGELIITGQLGEVMQESARAAVSYARSNLASYGLSPKDLDNLDIHIHVPAGAIPKDGPSAGIAIATALISALSQRPVDTNVAMTGEITLRGRVLPIGGIKEKALGAQRANIQTIIIPDKNKKDLTDIPASAKRKLIFKRVKSMEEVLAIALLKKSTKPIKKKTPKAKR
jgi:ATP-dependent Lon protease